MLIVGVALLLAIDLTVLIIYMVVEDARDNLKARQVPFRENEEDSEGVSGVDQLKAQEMYMYTCSFFRNKAS